MSAVVVCNGQNFFIQKTENADIAGTGQKALYIHIKQKWKLCKVKKMPAD